jgi:hypothetical protein
MWGFILMKAYAFSIGLLGTELLTFAIQVHDSGDVEESTDLTANQVIAGEYVEDVTPNLYEHPDNPEDKHTPRVGFIR